MVLQFIIVVMGKPYCGYSVHLFENDRETKSWKILQIKPEKCFFLMLHHKFIKLLAILLNVNIIYTLNR